MGHQERNEIIASAHDEQREAKRTLALLEARSRIFSAHLKFIAQELWPTSTIVGRDETILPIQGFDSAVEKYPTREEVIEVRRDIQAIRTRIRELDRLLSEM